MSGLQNRFPPEIEQFWEGSDYRYECAECGQNHGDVIHHIISPTAYSVYIKGKHNESIFNSCKIGNDTCHIHKPMQGLEKQKRLLKRTRRIIMEAVENKEYYLTDIDNQFLIIYKKLYE